MIIDHSTPPEILTVGARVNAAGVLAGADYMALRACGHTLELSHDDVRKGHVTAADYWEAITKLEGK